MRTRARQRIWIEMVAEPHLPRSEMDIHVQPEPFEQQHAHRARRVPSRHVLELADAPSGDMRLSDHAARSMI
jgi:hypothetical protein